MPQVGIFSKVILLKLRRDYMRQTIPFQVNTESLQPHELTA
jgi:hypothetical protein